MPPNNGPMIPPQMLALCISPILIPILFLGTQADIITKHAGHRPEAIPWKALTKNSSKGVLTIPPKK